jgi:multisubunit Na+/H+ antiporter MnhC subunit
MSSGKKRAPWYLWPFVALWNLIAGIVVVTGRLIAVVIGLALMIVGVILTITVIGAIVGIPLIIFGFLLTIRGFW